MNGWVSVSGAADDGFLKMEEWAHDEKAANQAEIREGEVNE